MPRRPRRTLRSRRLPEVRAAPEVFMDKAEGERALLDLHDILEKLGMKYFLVMGTALGAYRDKGFTPTEKDIDIGFLYENFTPYIGDLARELVLSGFAVRPISRPFRKCRVLVASRNDVKIDLVTYVLWRDRRFCSNADHKTKPYSIVHHRSILENYQRLEVFGREFLVPSPIEEYLSLEYGPAWRVPVQDHRSRTRVYEFRNLVGIQDDFLDS